MCISQFLVEEETLSPIYAMQWNVFLEDSVEFSNNTVLLQPAVKAENAPAASAYEGVVLDVQHAA